MVLKEAHDGNAQVQDRMYATYQREYENFTHLPGESIDALSQWLTVVVNNMRDNVDVLPYDDHDRAVKLLHSLDHTVCCGKFKSAEVDRGMTDKIEGPTNTHSLALIGGSKGKSDANLSTMMFSLSSLMSLPDKEFDVLGEDELVLLIARINRVEGMLSDTIKVCERVKRPCTTSSPSSMPLGLRNIARVASRYMKRKIQTESGPKTQDRGSCRSHLDEPCPIHEKPKHTARQCRVLKKLRRPLTAAHRC
jgi:hypothetical protein